MKEIGVFATDETDWMNMTDQERSTVAPVPFGFDFRFCPVFVPSVSSVLNE